MKVVRCDHCGKIMDIDAGKHVFICGKTDDDGKPVRTFMYNTIISEADLCEDCMNEFFSYIRLDLNGRDID